MVCLWNVSSRCLNAVATSWQSKASVSQLRLTGHMFAELRMYYVRILMSFSSARTKSFLSSGIIAGDLEVRWVKEAHHSLVVFM